MRTSNAKPPSASARVTALRMLAQRRLTEAKLFDRLVRRGFDDETVRAAVRSVRADGLLDDGLVATLYVAGARKAVGDARLVADLVRRGVDREIAQRAVERGPLNEAARIVAAAERIERTQPGLAAAAVARKLERLGFPAALIYRVLRERSRERFPELADLA